MFSRVPLVGDREPKEKHSSHYFVPLTRRASKKASKGDRSSASKRQVEK